MIRSSCSAGTPARASAFSAAATIKSDVVCSGAIQRRSRMPTFSISHWSVDAPSSASTSALVTTRSGT
jgi:hypothetical protein